MISNLEHQTGSNGVQSAELTKTTLIYGVIFYGETGSYGL